MMELMTQTNQNNNPLDYQEQVRNNEQAFLDTLQKVYPELHILAVQLYQTGVNPMPLFHVIKHMAEIAGGTGFGQVTIVIEEGIVRFVKGLHQSKVNERVIKNP